MHWFRRQSGVRGSHGGEKSEREAPHWRSVQKFQTYFDHESPHQGIGNHTVIDSGDVKSSAGKVVRIPRVWGLINL